MKKVKETINENKNGNSTNGNQKPVEFVFDDSKTAKSLIKVLKTTRQRLYPERYDEKGNLKAECVK